MTCSLASRILFARQRQPVTTARLLCDHTAAHRAILKRGCSVPGVRPSAPTSSPLRPTKQFKTHNAAVPNRLTSSRSIENAPAFRFRVVLEVHRAGAFPIEP